MFFARLDSNVYEAGSTAKVHVNVDNDSSVDIENFVLKVSLFKTLSRFQKFSGLSRWMRMVKAQYRHPHHRHE